MNEVACIFEKQIITSIYFNYFLYLPKEYGQDPNKRWPLLLCLHGVGERGNTINELERIKVNGIPKFLEDKEDFPFVVVCPQCPTNSFWVVQVENLNKLLDTLLEEYAVDEKMVYLTGFSMGGYGAWYFAMAYPEKFAAIAPICGGGMAWNAPMLANLPVWAFHGDKDPVVSFRESENMVNALKDCGGNVKFTLYKDIDHDSWTTTYNNTELYKWFLEQKKA